MSWWNFCTGYVIMEAEGLRLEAYLDAMASNGLHLTRILRLSYTKVRFRISSERLALRLAGEYGVRCTALSYSGLLALWSFSKKRPALPIALGIMVCAAFILTNLCLGIEFTGFNTAGEFEATELIKTMGITPPLAKSECDLSSIESALKVQFPQIVYVKAWFEGTRLKISVIEGTLPLAAKDRTPGALVAQKDGVVVRVCAERGKALVSPGQKVSAGDILISGTYLTAETTERNVAAKGSVMAQVLYRAGAPVGETSELVATGDSSTVRFLKIGKRELKLEGENPFDLWLETKTVIARIADNMPLSLELYEIRYDKAIRVVTQSKLLIAMLQAKEDAYYSALSRVPQGAQILATNTNLSEDSKEVVVEIITLEEIAQKIGDSEEEVGNSGN